MAEFIKGDVIVIPFPFSDLSSLKRRPALIIAIPIGNDIIACQITSKFHYDTYSIELDNDDFKTGSLNQLSYIRPNRLISIDKGIIKYKVGALTNEIFNNVIDKIIDIIKS